MHSYWCHPSVEHGHIFLTDHTQSLFSPGFPGETKAFNGLLLEVQNRVQADNVTVMLEGHVYDVPAGLENRRYRDTFYVNKKPGDDAQSVPEALLRHITEADAGNDVTYWVVAHREFIITVNTSLLAQLNSGAKFENTPNPVHIHVDRVLDPDVAGHRAAKIRHALHLLRSNIPEFECLHITAPTTASLYGLKSYQGHIAGKMQDIS